VIGEVGKFSNPYLKDLLHEADQIAKDLKSRFGSLSSNQLNWKPDESQWSIGQCIDHLIYFGARYYQSAAEIHLTADDPSIGRWLSDDPLANKFPPLIPNNNR
jgi:hypothetical protein